MNAVVLAQNWYTLKCRNKPFCRLWQSSFFKHSPSNATQQVRFCCQWAVGLPLYVSSYHVTHVNTRLMLHHPWPTPHVCWYFLRNKYFLFFINISSRHKNWEFIKVWVLYMCVDLKNRAFLLLLTWRAQLHIRYSVFKRNSSTLLSDLWPFVVSRSSDFFPDLSFWNNSCNVLL